MFAPVFPDLIVGIRKLIPSMNAMVDGSIANRLEK